MRAQKVRRNQGEQWGLQYFISCASGKGAPGVQRFGLDGGDAGPRGHSPTAGGKDGVNAAFASTVPAQDVKAVSNVNNNTGEEHAK